MSTADGQAWINELDRSDQTSDLASVAREHPDTLVVAKPFQPSPRPDLALGPIGSYASGQCPFGCARGEFMHAFERTT